MQNHEKFYLSLSPEEKGIFNLYKSNDPLESGFPCADYLNTMLGKKISLPKEMNSIVNDLDKIIQKHSLESEMWLYRATDDKYIAPYIKDGFLTYPPYVSTATGIDRLQIHFRNADKTPTLLRIKCPKGAFVAPMEGNSEYGDPEHEYLLGRNGVFKLINRKEITETPKIVEIMGSFYAREFSKLIDYTFEFLHYKEN